MPSSTSSSNNLALPNVGEHLLISVPAPHVLQLTLNRPKQLNAMTDALEGDLKRSLDWFESEPSLWVVILTGKGRAFCAGQDLKDWLSRSSSFSSSSPGPESAPATSEPSTVAASSGLSSADMESVTLESENTTRERMEKLNRGGFGSVSSRRSKKPIVAAVDGICLGGGTEMVLNCDLVLASSRSIFGLPEVQRGVVAAQGGIPRLSQICGHQRASELLLRGKPISASEAYSRFHFVNFVLPLEKSTSIETGQSAIEAEALRWAVQITKNSPDAVSVTKEALVIARDAPGDLVDESTKRTYESAGSRALYVGRNFREGLTAFKEKRDTKWSDPPVIKSKL